MISCYYLTADKKISSTNDFNRIQDILTDMSTVSCICVSNLSDNELKFLLEFSSHQPVTLKNFASQKYNANVEECNDYISTLFYDISLHGQTGELNVEPLMTVLTKHSTLLIAKRDSLVLEEIVSRISDKPEEFLTNSSKSFSNILETIVENHFSVIDLLEEKLDGLEEYLLNGKEDSVNKKIIKVRKDILKLKKALNFEQEIIYRLLNSDTEFISKDNLGFIKNIFHHLEKLNSTIDEYKTWSTNLMEQYSSNLSSKLNDFVQKLTIVSFIFLPLSFLSGWYGMNFKNIPELDLDYGYFYLIGFVLVLTASLLIYFKKKRWL